MLRKRAVGSACFLPEQGQGSFYFPKLVDTLEQMLYNYFNIFSAIFRAKPIALLVYFQLQNKRLSPVASLKFSDKVCSAGS